MSRNASSPSIVPSTPTMSAGGVSGAADELDPELLALPDPPKRGRTLTVLLLALTALASLAMAFALRRDVSYAFASSTATDLGELFEVSRAELAAHENAYVSARGLLGAAGGIRYERPFHDDTFRVLPVAGRSDLWVEVRVPEGRENPRWEPPRSVAGRLVRFDRTGPRHRGIREAIAEVSGQSVGADGWLIVDGEAPASARGSIALVALFVVFASWNVVTIARLVRKVR